jgi:hypothetical protein
VFVDPSAGRYSWYRLPMYAGSDNAIPVSFRNGMTCAPGFYLAGSGSRYGRPVHDCADVSVYGHVHVRGL